MGVLVDGAGREHAVVEGEYNLNLTCRSDGPGSSNPLDGFGADPAHDVARVAAEVLQNVADAVLPSAGEACDDALGVPVGLRVVPGATDGVWWLCAGSMALACIAVRGRALVTAQFSTPIPDARLLNPVGQTSKAPAERRPKAYRAGGRFGFGFKQTIAAILSLGWEYTASGPLPRSFRVAGGRQSVRLAAVVVEGFNTAGLRGELVSAPQEDFAEPPPAGVKVFPSSRGFRQRVVFAGAAGVDVADAVRRTLLVLAGPPVRARWLAPTLRLLERGDKLVLFDPAPGESPTTYINGVRLVGRDGFGGASAVVLADDVKRYTNTERNSMYDRDAFDELLEEFWTAAAAQEACRPGLLTCQVDAPDSPLADTLYHTADGSWRLKRAIADAIEAAHGELLMQADVDAMRDNPLWSRLGGDDSLFSADGTLLGVRVHTFDCDRLCNFIETVRGGGFGGFDNDQTTGVELKMRNDTRAMLHALCLRRFPELKLVTERTLAWPAVHALVRRWFAPALPPLRVWPCPAGREDLNRYGCDNLIHRLSDAPRGWLSDDPDLLEDKPAAFAGVLLAHDVDAAGVPLERVAEELLELVPGFACPRGGGLLIADLVTRGGPLPADVPHPLALMRSGKRRRVAASADA